MRIHHKVIGKIHLLTFDNRQELARTFLRFQEHYESPGFKGRVFTLDEFKQWYVKHSPKGKKAGKFTYYSDWSGFNIPSPVLKRFYAGEFDPLSYKERRLLEIFADVKGEFYIIGVHRKAKDLHALVKHEMAHGLFATNMTYRRKVLATLKRFDLTGLKNNLRSKSGYHEDVLDDECHAYSLTPGKRRALIPVELEKELNMIYRSYV